MPPFLFSTVSIQASHTTLIARNAATALATSGGWLVKFGRRVQTHARRGAIDQLSRFPTVQTNRRVSCGFSYHHVYRQAGVQWIIIIPPCVQAGGYVVDDYHTTIVYRQAGVMCMITIPLCVQTDGCLVDDYHTTMCTDRRMSCG